MRYHNRTEINHNLIRALILIITVIYDIIEQIKIIKRGII